jgi:hypothetical protein
LLARVVVVSASNHDQGGHTHHRGEQEKADNYKCLKNPGHRCAPVYTLARVPQEDPQREYANQPTFSQNVGFFIKSSQSRKTDFHWLLHPELFRPGFRHIVQAWQIPRDCRVCLALAPVKHKVWPLVG